MRAKDDSIRVLHVDDEPDFASMAAEFLEREDERFSIDTVINAPEGLDHLAEDDYDCIISDYDMPGQNGIEFLESVRDKYPELPFILYTGKGSEEVASEAIATGVSGYLKKETGTSQFQLLAHRVQNSVGKYRSERAIEKTEQKLSQLTDKTERERERFRALFENMSDAVAWIEYHGETPVITQANSTFIDFFQAPGQDVIGEPIDQIVAGENRRNDAEELSRRVKAGEQLQAEIVRDTVDGPRTFQWEAVPLMDYGTNSNDQAFAVYRDITRLRQRETELERYETIIEALGDPVYAIDADGRYTFVNESFVEETGQPREQILGEHISMIVPDEYVQRGRELIRELLRAENRRTVTWEMDRLTADQESDPVENHMALLPFEDGEFQGTAGVLRDITERRQREQKLERERSRIDLALKATDSYIYEIGYGSGDEWRIGDFERLHGLPEEAVSTTEKFVQRAVHPEDRATLRRIHELIDLEPGVSVEFEYRTNPEHGDISWIRTELVLESVPGSDYPRGVGLATDITDRKEHEFELRQERNRLQAIMEVIPDVVIIVDSEGRYQEVLTGHEELLIEDPEGHVGKNVTESMRAATTNQIQDTIETTLETESLQTIEYPFEIDGQEAWFEARVVPISIESDPRVLFLARDVTERVEREQTLAQLQRATVDLVSATSRDGVAKVLARAARDILGYAYPVVRFREGNQLVPAHAVEGLRTEADTIPTYPIDDSFAGDAFTSGEVQVYDDVRRLDDAQDRGKARAVMYAPIGGKGVISVADTEPGAFGSTDVMFMELLAGTARSALEVIDQRLRLRQQNERLDEFASVVSHDLRNPLAVAAGRLDLAKEECDSEHLEAVGRALDRMEALIEDVLTLARTGESLREPEPVTIPDIIEKCCQTVDTKDSELVVESEPTIMADKSRLRQLLENLLRNAVQHGGEDVTVTVGVLDDGFYVEDDGSGIPEHERQEVFDAGYTTAEEGTGLGLSIVQRVGQAHRWSISVTEGSAGGARFEITGVQFVD